MPEFILTDRIDSLPIGERWNVRLRLEELAIGCECRKDGLLDIHIKNADEALLVRMILLRHQTSRPQHLAWLERCWHLSPASGG